MKLFPILMALAASALGVQASTSTAFNSQTTPFTRCSTAASTSMSRCVAAIQSVEIDGTSDDTYAENLEQCWCSSISNMVECYPDTSTSTVSRLLSSWASRGCDALITGTVPGTAAMSEAASETGSWSTQSTAATTTGENGDGGNAATGNTLPGWWVMPAIMVVGVITGGFAVWL